MLREMECLRSVSEVFRKSFCSLSGENIEMSKDMIMRTLLLFVIISFVRMLPTFRW